MNYNPYILLDKSNETANIRAYQRKIEDKIETLPEHFAVNNTETGNQDIYAKPMSPKSSGTGPPPPPPRAVPPKQKISKSSNTELLSQNIYDNPTSCKSNKNDNERLSLRRSIEPTKPNLFVTLKDTAEGKISFLFKISKS